MLLYSVFAMAFDRCLIKDYLLTYLQFEIKLFYFFYRSKRLTDYIYMDIYCKLSKCIGQTPCSYEHYLVGFTFNLAILYTGWI